MATDKPEKIYATLDSISLYTERILILSEPPILPKQGTREHIRKNGLTPLRETQGRTENRGESYDTPDNSGKRSHIRH